MYLYNSLTNQKEEFKPLEPNKVKMYVCGPTVYNYLHVGNARPLIFFDVVKRYLEQCGYEVTFVSNITDVDDKIIKAAKVEGVSEEIISNKYKEAFFNNLKQLQCVDYDITPNVTSYMDEIIQFIKELEDLGYAYEAEGDVYFSVNKISSYGQLSNQDVEHLEVGARVTSHSKKKNPLDFTLWKKTSEGIQWDSPWGRGRPGWHTECAVMINDTLGPIIDIHGGGTDLKFPHHENEIAQSQAKNQTSLAKYWMHNGRLMIDDEKMSKSIGNVITINDFVKVYDFRVLRLFMLSNHYRQPLNYTSENIENIKNEVSKIETSLKKLQFKLDLNHYLDVDVELDDFSKGIIQEFNQSMDDDFNTANAVTALMSLIKEINKNIRKQKFNEEELKHMASLHQTFKNLLQIFGMDYDIPRFDENIRELIKEREEARNNKDYARADEIREILQARGINI